MRDGTFNTAVEDGQVTPKAVAEVVALPSRQASIACPAVVVFWVGGVVHVVRPPQAT